MNKIEIFECLRELSNEALIILRKQTNEELTMSDSQLTTVVIVVAGITGKYARLNDSDMLAVSAYMNSCR